MGNYSNEMLKKVRSLVRAYMKRWTPEPLWRFASILKHETGSVVKKYKRVKKNSITRQDLLEDLKAAGFGKGDLLCVHSSLSRVGNVEGAAQSIIQSILDVVGNEGTVLMPTYSDAAEVFTDYEQGKLVDLRVATSRTGAITEAFRKMSGVRRSSHPFSSMCAWGRHADYLTQDHHAVPEIAHADSPLGRLWKLDGILLGLGVSLGPVSFYHVLEDTWDGFPFEVYLPAVHMAYIDSYGVRVERPIRRLNPEISKSRIDHPAGAWIRGELEKHLRRVGILHDFKYGEADCWYMKSSDLYEELKRLALSGVTIYLTQDQWHKDGF